MNARRYWSQTATHGTTQKRDLPTPAMVLGQWPCSCTRSHSFGTWRQLSLYGILLLNLNNLKSTQTNSTKTESSCTMASWRLRQPCRCARQHLHRAGASRIWASSRLRQQSWLFMWEMQCVGCHGNCPFLWCRHATLLQMQGCEKVNLVVRKEESNCLRQLPLSAIILQELTSKHFKPFSTIFTTISVWTLSNWQ